MKRNLSIKILTIHQVMMYLLAFGVSLPDKFIPMILAGWLLTTIGGILFGVFEKPLEKISIFHPATFLLLFSAWSLFSLVYSEDLSNGLDLLVRRLSLILFAGAVFVPFNPIVNRKSLFIFFIAGNISMMFLILTKGLLNVYTTPVWTDSLYLDPFPFMKYLLEGVKHRAYLGLNLAVSLLFLYYLATENKKMKWSVLLLSISFILISALTYGRISVLIVTMLALFANLNLWIKSKKSLAVVYLSLVFSLVILIALFHPRFNSLSDNSTEDMPRAKLWTNAIELIKEKPIFGYGIGDAESIFNRRNDSEPDSSVAGKNLNAHNQFIDFHLESGIIGFMLFIVFMVLLVFKRRFEKEGRIMFALIWFVCLIFETMLNRIAAVSVLGFTVFLLYNQNFKESTYKIGKSSQRSLFVASALLILYSTLVISYALFNSREIDPLNPDTFSMNDPRTIIYENLPGILPDAMNTTCKAVMLDSMSNSETWAGNANSFILVGNKKVNKDMELNAGVYCFVSEDFNGHSVRLVAEGSASEGRIDVYDLNQKGHWQYLNISPEIEKGRIPVYLYMTLKDATSFKKLKGYVLFACPTTEISKIKED